MTATHRPMVESDIDAVLGMKLCPEDEAELTALTGQDTETVLIESLTATNEPWVVLLDGRIVAVYGVSHAATEAGCSFGMPWLLSTGELKLFSRKFLRESKAVIAKFHQHYTTLSNLVDIRHTRAIRWLKWLGFEFLEGELLGHDTTVPFKQFVRCKS